MTEVQSEAAGNSQQAAAQPAEAAHPAVAQMLGNPAVLGLMIFAVGSLVLGISLEGNVPLAVQPGSVQPMVYASTGLILLITTIWAAAVHQTFVATILGVFTGFWFSYAAMVIGLTHNWYAIPAADVSHTLGQFLIGWDAAIFMLFLVTLWTPMVFAMILGVATVGVSLLCVAVLSGSAGVYHAGGVFVLIFAALGFYAYLSTALQSVGGPNLPLGKPVASMFSK